MSAHTPGPWKVTPRFQDKVDIMHVDNSVGASTKCVCRVNVRQSWLEEQSANARLIAAAPDLLAVARMVIGDHHDDSVYKAAQAAIAKATQP